MIWNGFYIAHTFCDCNMAIGMTNFGWENRVLGLLGEDGQNKKSSILSSVEKNIIHIRDELLT